MQSKRIPGETRCTVAWNVDLDLLPVRMFAHAPWPVHDALASVLSRDCRLLRPRYRSAGVSRQAGLRRSLARGALHREMGKCAVARSVDCESAGVDQTDPFRHRGDLARHARAG